MASKTETLRIDAPTGKLALHSLQKLGVGDSFTEAFIPALSIPLTWTCRKAEKDCWTLDGSFVGIPLLAVEITHVQHSLIMQVKEEA